MRHRPASAPRQPGSVPDARRARVHGRRRLVQDAAARAVVRSADAARRTLRDAEGRQPPRLDERHRRRHPPVHVRRLRLGGDMADEWFVEDGSPHPLGATWVEEAQSWNFALYSRHATGVSLLLYRAGNLTNPVKRVTLDYTRNKSGRVWHCRVP